MNWLTSMPMNSYTLLARYYDLDNAEFTADLDFWIELAEEHGGLVLELGCGTGRVLLPLAQRGYAITGIDNSPEMLARLNEKLQTARNMRKGDVASLRRVAPATESSILRADIADFTSDQRFPLALIAFNTFMHLLTAEAQIAALTNIRRHLDPGAVLAMDMINPAEAYAAHTPGVVLERSFVDGEHTVQVFSSIELDRAAQFGHITWIYDSVGADGAVQRTTVPLTMRYTFPGEMRLLLERCGFSLAHLYGDYDRSPFADGSPRMLVIAKADS